MTETSSTKEYSSLKRGNWDNETEFRLSVVGLTVGLGSIWRFPTLAYDNGGSAFLLPYLVCVVFVGLPMMYLEMVVGQYTNTGPSMIFRHYIPALQGIGWTMAITSMSICLYYCVVVGWSGFYFVLYAIGYHNKLIKCDNDWNDFWRVRPLRYTRHYCGTHADRCRAEKTHLSEKNLLPNQKSQRLSEVLTWGWFFMFP